MPEHILQSIFKTLLFSFAMACAAAPAVAQTVLQAPPPAASAASPAAPINPGVVRVLISAESETSLVAPMTGRVQDLTISLGSAFEKGRLLIGFDCSENAARLKIADGELKGARENYEAKARLQGLQAAGEVEVKLAAALVDKAVGQVELSAVQVAQCAVLAPFTGRVAKVHVKQHQVVSVGTPLADIISNGPLKVRVNAPSRWLRGLRAGTAFVVSVDETGRRYPVTVSAISARVDPAAQTIEIEGRFASAFPELLPGMSGTAQFTGLR
jgi:membrane fusion protein (multidrug efflux system)